MQTETRRLAGPRWSERKVKNRLKKLGAEKAAPYGGKPTPCDWLRASHSQAQAYENGRVQAGMQPSARASSRLSFSCWR